MLVRNETSSCLSCLAHFVTTCGSRCCWRHQNQQVASSPQCVHGQVDHLHFAPRDSPTRDTHAEIPPLDCPFRHSHAHSTAQQTMHQCCPSTCSHTLLQHHHHHVPAQAQVAVRDRVARQRKRQERGCEAPARCVQLGMGQEDAARGGDGGKEVGGERQTLAVGLGWEAISVARRSQDLCELAALATKYPLQTKAPASSPPHTALLYY